MYKQTVLILHSGVRNVIATVESRLLEPRGGTLRDDTKNGCVAD